MAIQFNPSNSTPPPSVPLGDSGGANSAGGAGGNGGVILTYPISAEDLKGVANDEIAKATADAMNRILGRLTPDALEKVDLQTLMFAVMSERANMLDDQVRSMAQEMQMRNNELKEANQMLSMARQINAAVKDGETADMPDSMRIYFANNGVETAGLSTDPTSPSSTFSVSSTDNSTGKVKTIEVNIKKIDDAITKGNAAKESVNNMPYADNCAIKRDLPEDAVNFAKAHGIPLPNGDGKNLKKDQIDAFKTSMDSKIAELGTQKTKATADLKIAKEAEAIDKAAETAAGERDPDLNIQGGFKPSDITISQTKDQWAANIENLKGHVEGLNNQSQLDMIKFQALMSKYTAQTEALSNVMKKLGDNMASLVGNLR